MLYGLTTREGLPWTLSSFFWEFSLVYSLEYLHILLKSPVGNACANSAEEVVNGVVIMNLKQRPRKHLLCVEQMSDVGPAMFLACITLAASYKRGHICFAGGWPHVQH